jgi:hypothetical protein
MGLWGELEGEGRSRGPWPPSSKPISQSSLKADSAMRGVILKSKIHRAAARKGVPGDLTIIST